MIAPLLLFGVLAVSMFREPDPNPPPPLASLELTCPTCIAPVAPNTPLTWQLHLQVGFVPEDLGLAGFSVDMIQPFGNPAGIVLIPAARPTTGTNLARFDRPLGIANPDPPGGTAGSAFGGTPLPAANSIVGGVDLIQIGGGQNTFGTTGVNIGASTTVVAGVGIASGGLLVASGTFIAPGAPGNYQVQLQRGLVNVLTSIGGTGVPSSVRSCIVDLGAPISFTVDPNVCPADFNHDATVDPDDLADFVACYFQETDSSGTCPAADFNADSVTDPDDLADFIAAYFAGC